MPGSSPRLTNCGPTATNMNVFVLYTPLYPRVYRGIPILLREGQVETDGPRRPHGGQKNRTTKNFSRAGSVCHILETLPEFNDIYDETFPNSLHEEVHEDVSYCTMVKSYQFAKYLQQFNKLQAEWRHKVSICKKKTKIGT
ncbi:hypothetical protein TNCV_1936671 [Trichonephila clavipes]|nr:hypothetical protein TNCV_1936671 [Trichonephila clavipes]